MDKIKSFFNSAYADYVFWGAFMLLVATSPAIVAIPTGAYAVAYFLSRL